MRAALPALLITAAASPAHAWAGVQIPEPSNLALFALGLAGVAIGRRFARARRNHDGD
jgi:hypothetical protein